MNNAMECADVATRRIRRIARIWSLAVIAFTLMMAVGHIVEPEPVVADYPPIENLLPVLMFMCVMSLALAWRWEALGGALNVGLFVVHWLAFWIIRGEFFPLGALLTLSVAIVPGVLFLVCWRRSSGRA